MISNRPKWVILTITLFLLALDRLAKSYALNYLSNTSINVTSWFKLSLSINNKIAFSLPISGLILAIILIIILLALFRYLLYFRTNNEPKLALVLTVLIISAITNALDRILYGGVIDYLDLKYFTAFNLADTMITVSVITLIVLLIKNRAGDKVLKSEKID